MKVFLGGTCNGSKWRDEMMIYLDEYKIEYFNPIVEDWKPSDMKREIEERKNCDYCIYTITPEMTGVYSIAEVVDDSNKKPSQTIFILLLEYGGKSFNDEQTKSLEQVGNMVQENGGLFLTNLKSVIEYIKG